MLFAKAFAFYHSRCPYARNTRSPSRNTQDFCLLGGVKIGCQENFSGIFARSIDVRWDEGRNRIARRVKSGLLFGFVALEEYPNWRPIYLTLTDSGKASNSMRTEWKTSRAPMCRSNAIFVCLDLQGWVLDKPNSRSLYYRDWCSLRWPMNVEGKWKNSLNLRIKISRHRMQEFLAHALDPERYLIPRVYSLRMMIFNVDIILPQHSIVPLRDNPQSHFRINLWGLSDSVCLPLVSAACVTSGICVTSRIDVVRQTEIPVSCWLFQRQNRKAPVRL